MINWSELESELEIIIKVTFLFAAYRNWMNSMGVSPYVHYIYNDLTDGLIVFQLYDICKPGVVDWKRVIKKFNKMRGHFEKIGRRHSRLFCDCFILSLPRSLLMMD